VFEDDEMNGVGVGEAEGDGDVGMGSEGEGGGTESWLGGATENIPAPIMMRNTKQHNKKRGEAT